MLSTFIANWKGSVLPQVILNRFLILLNDVDAPDILLIYCLPTAAFKESDYDVEGVVAPDGRLQRVDSLLVTVFAASVEVRERKQPPASIPVTVV